VLKIPYLVKMVVSVEIKKVVMGPMRRVIKQNETMPIVVGLLRRVFTKTKQLNSLDLPEFMERVGKGPGYHDPHCGPPPGVHGGSRPRDECAGEVSVETGEQMVQPSIQGPRDFGENVPIGAKWMPRREYRAIQEQIEHNAMDWGEENFDEFVESLSDEEILAMSSYRVQAYDPINDYLRKGKLDPYAIYTEEEVRELIPMIEGVLDKTQIPEEVYAYRAMRMPEFKDPKEMIGETFTDFGFASTTMVPHMTHVWMEQPSETPRFVAKIRIPQGTNAAYISHITHKDQNYYPEETEILLQRNTRFRILGLNNDGSIDMEVIGEE